MATGRAETRIDSDPDAVWKVVGDFGGLASWMPGIEKCELAGDVRTLQTMGIEIKEQLRGRDDASRSITYGIIESPMPVEHHEATITVNPDGAGAHVTWDVEVRPDNLIDAFVPIYQQSLDQLRTHLAGS
jgi:carbon monoxide dehydrogenase subunit G